MLCLGSSIGFRLIRKLYPWLPLAMIGWRMTLAREPQRLYEQVRFWNLLFKVDFATLLEIALDMIHPEYWA